MLLQAEDCDMIGTRREEDMRVLLVEDDRSLSAAICRLLEKERITVDPVYDGNDGLDWALSSEYDAMSLLHRLGNLYEPLRFLPRRRR